MAAARERLFGPPRCLEGVARGHVQIAVNLRIDALDALQIRVGGLERRYFPGANPARQGYRGLVAQVVLTHRSLPSASNLRRTRGNHQRYLLCQNDLSARSRERVAKA